MERILIDTMHLGGLLKDDSYFDLAGAISDGDIEAICSNAGKEPSPSPKPGRTPIS